MNEHIQQTHNEHIQQTHVVDRLPRISWGAIFAGLVVVLATSWLMHLFGTAIGVSVADANDTAAIGEGMASGAALWIVLSWLTAFFLGSLVASRLAGSVDDLVGMLHGFTLWGVATIVVVVLTYYGVASLLETGRAAMGATAQGIGTIASGTVSMVATGAEQTGSAVTAALDTEFGRKVRDRLADEAVEMAANVDQQLSEQEIRQAIEDLDERTVRRIVQDMTNEDTEGAAQLLADNTELSQQDARALIDGAYDELEEQFGDPTNQQPLRQDLQNQLARQVDSYIAQLDPQGGPVVTEQDVRDAISQLDGQALQAIATNLVNGDARGAKRVLAQNTDLSRQQIDELYEGATSGMETELQEYQTSVNEVLETATDYAQSVLWLSFAGSAIALVVSLGGGWIGTTSARRTYVE